MLDIEKRAMALGFNAAIPICIEPFEEWRTFRDARIAQGGTAGQGLFHDPLSALPSAQTLWVLATGYAPHSPLPAGHMEVDGVYPARQAGYLRTKALAQALMQTGSLAITDPPLPAKSAALRAGLGIFGRNGLLLSHRWGSWVALNLLLTDQPHPGALNIRPDTPYCQNCGACESACPVRALANGVVNDKLCLRNHMLTGNAPALPLRPLLGARLVGCNICQAACPWNAHVSLVPPSQELVSATSIAGFLEPESNAFAAQQQALATIIGANYARRNKLLAAALTATGTAPRAEYTPALTKLLTHPEEWVRLLAQWALEQTK